MARALLAMLVAGMLTLTGYYAYSSVSHEEARIAPAAKPSCCDSHATKSCCSEKAADCTGECPSQATKKDGCCSEKGTECTGECPHGDKKEACPSEGGCCKNKDKATTKKD